MPSSKIPVSLNFRHDNQISDFYQDCLDSVYAIMSVLEWKHHLDLIIYSNQVFINDKTAPISFKRPIHCLFALEISIKLRMLLLKGCYLQKLAQTQVKHLFKLPMKSTVNFPWTWAHYSWFTHLAKCYPNKCLEFLLILERISKYFQACIVLHKLFSSIYWTSDRLWLELVRDFETNCFLVGKHPFA